jgi:hypothetical protein
LLKVTLYTIILTQNMEKNIFRGILGLFNNDNSVAYT